MTVVFNAGGGAIKLSQDCVFYPGSTKVDDAVWKRHSSKPVVQGLLQSGRLRVLAGAPAEVVLEKAAPQPEPEQPVDDDITQDNNPNPLQAMTAKDAMAHVKGILEKGPLEAMLTGETRSTVIKAIKEQLEFIDTATGGV